MTRTGDRAALFRSLHHGAEPLLLANAWDAGSARVIESCGAAAIATTSAGLAWSRGYPDGDALPPAVLVAAVREIARVLSVPLTVDIEGGYSTDPRAVGEVVSAVIDAGGVGINIEDGSAAPDLLVAKIGAARAAADRAGVALFINARTDVFLRRLAPPERAAAETLDRAARYREAGCDGLFVPYLREPAAIRSIAAGIGVPLNVMLMPGLASAAELRDLGVRRISAGSAIAEAVHGLTARAATGFLREGRTEAMFEGSADYREINGLFARPASS
jgi:2-methylisocitrate lyase-like PEP mutase family enzyme